MALKEASIVNVLLSRAHSPDSATRIFTEKILHRPLLLKPSTHIPTAQEARRQQRKQRQKLQKKKPQPLPLSARKKRALALYEIPRTGQKYHIYEPLHRMWIGYIHEVLWDGRGFNPINSGQAAKLCSADFHGAELEVVRSCCVSRVGVKGIVVKESKRVFELITKRDRLKIVPKEGTVFRFLVPVPFSETRAEKLPTLAAKAEVAGGAKKQDPTVMKDLIFELHGDQFQYRAADRANRKFKPHFLPNL